jgi:hypothetical protein
MIISSKGDLKEFLRKFIAKSIAAFLFTLLFSHSEAFPQTSVTQIDALETTNSFPGHWCCANDGYLYGTDARIRKIVIRKREDGQATENRGDVTSIDPSFSIDYKIFSTSIPGQIFILVKNTSENFFLLKSADGGLTFKNVFTFGEGNGASGASTADVRILRGLLELTTDLPGGGGKGTLYIGEYNVAKNRIAGSVNDRVRIMKSTDNGETWTKVVEWNTNGSNQVGHIHAMKQDPYTGEIYICVGDSNNKSGIIKWDGKSAWPDNRTVQEIGNLTGFKVHAGSQRFRVCDVLFGEDFFYTFTDTQQFNNQSGSESGIWRGSKDFLSYTRMDNQIFDYDPMHVGWFGEKIGNTYIFTTSREMEPGYPWKEMNTRVYCSSDGVNWYATGVLNWWDSQDTNLSSYIRNVFSYNNKIYIDCIPGAGHFSTIQCSLTRKWKAGEYPVILHPVFFVGTWNSAGDDANSGYSPDVPKRSLSNLLSSNRISAATRVRIAAGTYYEPDIYPLWSGAFLQGKGRTVIEGQGMDATHIIRSSGTGDAYGIRVESARTLTDANTPLVLKDLDFFVATDGGANHSNHVIYNLDTYVQTENCNIGDITNDDSPLILLASTGAKYFSTGSYHITRPDAGQYGNVVQSNAPGTIYHFTNCVILNSYNAFENKLANTDFSIRNCTFYGIGSSAVIFSGGWNTKPVIKNCIFSCAGPPIQNLVTLPDQDIDYNYYQRDNVGLTDGGHSLKGDIPLFVNPSAGNFNLQSNSPAIMSGVKIQDVTEDITGRLRKDPPCIGAFENIGLIVSPQNITILASSEASGNLNIRSNTNWQVTGFDQWLSISSLSGIGNDVVTVISHTSNPSTLPRVSNVTFSATDANPITIAVTQQGDTSTGLKETEEDKLNVYPNPSNGSVTIEYFNTEYLTVQILNSKGIVISKFRTSGPIYQLDLSRYGKGLYILEFTNNKGETMRRKIINN